MPGTASVLVFAAFCYLYPMRCPGWIHISSSCDSVSHRPLRVGITPWTGFAGGLFANGGYSLGHVGASSWSNESGVEFQNLDEFGDREKALSSKRACEGVDVLWTTVESWAAEAPSFRAQGVKARAVVLVAEPLGSHLLVVDAKTRDFSDLGRNSIVVSRFSPAHWLALLNVQNHEKIAIPVNSTESALDEFSHEKAAAIAVIETNESRALERQGATRLQTLDDKTGVAYILVAREELLHDQAGRGRLKDFIQKWLDGNEETRQNATAAVNLIHDNPAARKESPEHIQSELEHAHLSGWDENMTMFGLDGGPAAFDDRFRAASQRWLQWEVLQQPIPPDQARDASLLQEIFNNANPGLPAVRELCTQKANTVVKKSVIVFFDPSGSTEVRPNFYEDLNSIAYEMKIASSETQVCIDGYTDSVGSEANNQTLSEQRAQAVRDYLRNRGIGQTHVIAIGRGISHQGNNTLLGQAYNRRALVRVVTEGEP